MWARAARGSLSSSLPAISHHGSPLREPHLDSAGPRRIASLRSSVEYDVVNRPDTVFAFPIFVDQLTAVQPAARYAMLKLWFTRVLRKAQPSAASVAIPNADGPTPCNADSCKPRVGSAESCSGAPHTSEAGWAFPTREPRVASASITAA